MPALTTGQARFLATIAKLSTCGYPPTVRELCDELGLKSDYSGRKYIAQLTAAGMLRTNSGNGYRHARSLVLTDAARELLKTQ